MKGPEGRWVRERSDDEQIALAMAEDDKTIPLVYLVKSPNDIDPMTRWIASMGGSVSHIDRRVAYFRATVPISEAFHALDLPAGDAAAITACVRLSTPSFCKIAETWALTVASEKPSW